MSFRRRVLWRAQQDVDTVLDWIANKRKSPRGAAAWLNAFEDAAAEVENNPHRYGFAPENEVVDLEVRQFLFKTRRGRTYRGIFIVDHDEVLILRVRGPGQAPVEPNSLL